MYSIDDEPNRLLAADDESFDEGSFSNNEVVHTSSTSTDDDEASSCSDSCKKGTTIGINLEVALEIDHEVCAWTLLPLLKDMLVRWN